MRENTERDQRSIEGAIIRARLLSGVASSVLLTPLTLLATVAGSILIARALGPFQLSVITAFSSISMTVVTFLDLGISKSFPKIVPDIALRHGGRKRALEAAKILLKFQLFAFATGWATLVIADQLGAWQTRRLLGLDSSFLILIGVRVVLTALLNSQRGLATAALRTNLMIRLTALQAFFEPLLTVPLALATQNPYWIIAGGLALDLLNVLLLSRFGSYDLDVTNTAGSQTLDRLASLLRRYWRYLAMTYAQFLFNRFLISLSLLFWVMIFLKFDRSTIAQVGLAWSLTTQFWTIADIPFAQLQVPLMARLHSEEDGERFKRAKSIISAVNVFCSCLLLVAVFVLGEPLFKLLYGEAYLRAVHWGVQGALLALFLNMFSTGNRALQQSDRYLPQVIGMISATIFLCLALVLMIEFIDASELPLILLLSIVLSRGIFWLITDIWAEVQISSRSGIIVKFRGIAGLIVAVVIAKCVSAEAWPSLLSTACTSLTGFVAIFRLVGGIGVENRHILERLLPDRLKSFATLA